MAEFQPASGNNVDVLGLSTVERNGSEPDVVERPYTIKPLKARQTRKFAGMLGKASNDPRLGNALASGNEGTIMAGIIGVAMDRLNRDLFLFLADLIGIERDFKEYKKSMRAECHEDPNNMRSPQIAPYPTEEEIKRQMEEDILEEFDEYSIDTPTNIISDVIERDDFEPFLVSARRLGTVGSTFFSRFRSTSNENSDSETTNS